MFTVDVLFSGFSGKMEDCALGWGTFALIKREGVNILLDTGGVGLRTNFSKILGKHGVKAKDIDIVLLTHLHFDHARNVDLIPNATFVVHEKEWIHANNMIDKDLYIEESAVSYLRNSKLHILKNKEEEIIDSLIALHTPGHTPGCTSYLLNQKNGEVWGLVGDAIKNRGEIVNEEVQMTMDFEKTKFSIKEIKNRCNRILPGHDGWISIKGNKIIAEGGNDKKIIFGEGVTINEGKDSIKLIMD